MQQQLESIAALQAQMNAQSAQLSAVRLELEQVRCVSFVATDRLQLVLVA